MAKLDPIATYAALVASVPTKAKAKVLAGEPLPFAPAFLLSLPSTTPAGGILAVAFWPAYTSRKSGENVAASEQLVYWPTVNYFKNTTTQDAKGVVFIKEKAVVTKWRHDYFRDGAAAYNGLEMIETKK